MFYLHGVIEHAKRRLREKWIIPKIIGYPSTIITMSKGRYIFDHPQHIVIFNANIVTASCRKIWYGDIDLTLDEGKLILLAKELGEDLYILREMDARFENEENPKIDNYVYLAMYDMVGVLGDSLIKYVERIDGKLCYKKQVQEKVEYEFEPLEYDEKEFVSIPFRLKLLKKRNKKISPLDRFYFFIENMIKYGFVEGEEYLKRGTLYCTKELEESLKQIMLKWLVKYKGLRVKTYEYQKTENSLCLYLPSSFLGTPEWVKDNTIYLRVPKERSNEEKRKGEITH